MDYGFSWQNDLQGVGKYDAAAVIFGYTAHLKPKADCERPPIDVDSEFGSTQSIGDPCVEPVRGFVEVFKKSKPRYHSWICLLF